MPASLCQARIVLPLVFLTVLIGGPASSLACPFCAAPSRTLSEELAAADVVVLAKLVERGETGSDAAGPGSKQRVESKFDLVNILKGESLLGGKKRIEALYFGDAKPGAMFLMTAMVLPETVWTTPIPLSERGVKYIATLPSLPEKGPDRLKFFWHYLEDDDTLMAQDSYDEFARAPYSDVQSLIETLDRGVLIAWITNPDIAQSRRRLYFTLLGVCGTQDDLPMLESMMKSKERKTKSGLDALIGCYLSLRGKDGMPLVEELFLSNKEAEYSDTYAAIMAIRLMGQESNVVPRERLIVGLRHMLNRPDLADLVIPDLARWEDWSVMDRMIDLFKKADSGSNFVRVPVVNYLMAASQQKGEVGKKAQAAIDELTLIDAESVKRAKAYAIFGPLAAPKPKTPPAENGPSAEKVAPEKSPAPEKGAAPKKNAKAGKTSAATTTQGVSFGFVFRR